MTITYSSIDAVVARAEDFLSSGHIKTSQSEPALKRPGTGWNNGKGRAFEWLCQHVGYQEKKCLFWPFSKNNGHPGPLSHCGRVFKPARLMCLLAHGAPPSKQHQACHTCGRGGKGCINPKHLKWKTVSEARMDEFRSGHRTSYGRGGKLTPAEAAEIRAMAATKSISEIAKTVPLSPHRIGEILSGNAYKPRVFWPRGGRFYPRLHIARRTYSLGGYASLEQAGAAYEAARIRARLGEPIVPFRNEKPSESDIKRWYQPPSQQVTFGDREGEVVTAVEADQERSVFVMQRALDRLNPSVRKFVLVASDTGDLDAATEAAGLSQAQVAMLLPRLRVFIGSILH